MLCAAQIVALLARLTVSAPTVTGDSPAGAFLAPYAGEQLPVPFVDALDAFLRTEAAYDAGDYAKAATVLRALWERYPPGTDAWPGGLIQPAGLNIGSPPCYYGLRMYQDCVDWRLSLGDTEPPAPRAATLTVVLVGRTHGVEPRSWAELEADTGAEAEHSLDPLLRRDGNAVVHESLHLFAEWMLAMTEGRQSVRTRVVDLPDLDVPVSTSAEPYRLAGLGGGAMDQVWAALPPDTVASTDWWWVLYPSNVPEQYPDFTTTEFITGGMGRGPDGASPCFIIDDRWLVRKPPHLGSGPYTSVERRAYLPQWVQHEFMHHVFACYPGFGLEDRGHQWFDRASWPTDFEGRFEPDYYHEAMHKRILPLGEPPLHVALRYDAPPRELFREVTLDHVLGGYRHRPVENDWHEGTISREPEPGPDGQPVLRWTNRAGVSWLLTPDLAAGLLHCEPGSPYYDSDLTNGRAFRLALQRDGSGAYVPELRGFLFGQGLYEREGD